MKNCTKIVLELLFQLSNECFFIQHREGEIKYMIFIDVAFSYLKTFFISFLLRFHVTWFVGHYEFSFHVKLSFDIFTFSMIKYAHTVMLDVNLSFTVFITVAGARCSIVLFFLCWTQEICCICRTVFAQDCWMIMPNWIQWIEFGSVKEHTRREEERESKKKLQ